MALLPQLPPHPQLVYTCEYFSPTFIIFLSIEFFESKQNMQWTFSNCWSWSLFAASLTIAAFADWLGSAASARALLPMLLQLLTNALSAPEDACAAAALAIKHICDGEYLIKPGLWSIPYRLVKGVPGIPLPNLPSSPAHFTSAAQSRVTRPHPVEQSVDLHPIWLHVSRQIVYWQWRIP